MAEATQEMVASVLAEYDQAILPCPINNPTQGQVYAPYEKCGRCGARSDQNCGLEATASYHLIRALRAHLKEQSA